MNIRLMIKMLAAAIVAVLMTGCTTVEYRDKYSILTPDANLLENNNAPPPPVTPKQYGMLTDKQRVAILEPYVNDLLKVIGKEHADKAALRLYQETAQKKIRELNDAADRNRGK